MINAAVNNNINNAAVKNNNVVNAAANDDDVARNNDAPNSNIVVNATAKALTTFSNVAFKNNDDANDKADNKLSKVRMKNRIMNK